MKKITALIMICMLVLSTASCKERSSKDEKDTAGENTVDTAAFSDTSDTKDMSSGTETDAESGEDLFLKYNAENKEVSVPEKLDAYSFIYKSSDSISEEALAISSDGDSFLIYRTDGEEAALTLYISTPEGWEIYSADEPEKVLVDDTGKLTGIRDTKYVKEEFYTKEEFSERYTDMSVLYKSVCTYLKELDTEAALEVIDSKEGYVLSEPEDGRRRILEGDREAGYFTLNHEYGYIEEFVFEKNYLIMNFTPDYFGSISDILA